MFAASLLVVAVMATYASLAVMSLSGGGSLSFPTSLPGKVLTSLGNSVVGWHAPSAKDVLGVHDPSSSGSSQSVAFADSPYVNFGQVPTAGAAPAQISVTNTSSASLHLVLSVVNANGISATFDKTKTTQMVVHPHKPATINLTSDPLNAGPINGSLVVSIAKSGSTPLLIPLTGAQAPLASPSLTATPGCERGRESRVGAVAVIGCLCLCRSAPRRNDRCLADHRHPARHCDQHGRPDGHRRVLHVPRDRRGHNEPECSPTGPGRT